MSAVAVRYARAAEQAAFEKDGQAGVVSLVAGVAEFVSALDDSAELSEVLRNPAFRNEREGVLGGVTGALGVCDTAARLLSTLLRKDRFGLLAEVLVALNELANEREGRKIAKVFSVVALCDDQVLRVSRALERLVGPVSIEVIVNADLIGGLVCEVGDYRIDHSVAGALRRLGDSLERRQF